MGSAGSAGGCRPYIRRKTHRPIGIHQEPPMPPRPVNFDPAEPLRDARYERFAQLRAALGSSPCEAALEAGFLTKNGAPILAGNAAKIARRKDVRARVAYLRGDEAAVVREMRDFTTARLMKAARLDIVKRFGIIETYEHNGKQVGRLVGIDWAALQASEYSIAIEGFKFDGKTGLLTDFNRDSALNATAQLRDMYGLKGVEKYEHAGPGGAPLASPVINLIRPEQSAEDEPLPATDLGTDNADSKY
jgi:hypothetical protein